MPRGATTPPGNTAHLNWADMTHCWTFHSGASIVAAVKGGVTGTISGAGLTQSATTGLTCTNQVRFVTLGSSIALSGDYSIMWRSKTTGSAFNSLICSGTGSQYLQMSTGSNPDAIFFRDSVASTLLDSVDSELTSLVDNCLTVTSTTTKFYRKLATDTTWVLMETATRTGSPFTIATILDGTFSQSNVGELHYLQLFNGRELTATDLLNFADPYTISTPDVAGPVVGACTIPASGTYIEVPFTDESLPILPSSILGAGGFTVTASGGSATVTTVLRVAAGTLRLLLSRIILPAETVTWSYSGSTVTDSASTPNALGTVTNQAVTNNSTATGGTTTTQIETGRLPRSIASVEPIIFPWDTPSETLTGTKAFGAGPASALSGALNYERTIVFGGVTEHIYSLAYHPDDTPGSATSVVYRITDGVVTKKIILDVIAMSGDGNATSYEIVVSDANNTPIPHCICWVATNQAGTNVITDKFETDSFGKVNFVLIPGTYWLFRQKNGVTFSVNPKEFTIV